MTRRCDQPSPLEVMEWTKDARSPRTAERGTAEGCGDPLTLPYTNWRGETATRTILPIRWWFGSTDWHPGPGWLLRAFDQEKKAERDFSLSGFLAAAEERGAERMRERAAQVCDQKHGVSVKQKDGSWLRQGSRGASAIRALPLHDTPAPGDTP